jgi:DNA-binding response OmpR family regulator
MTYQENIGPRLAGRRVLVAEDDPLIAAELQDALSDHGAEVVGPVPTVRAAMAAIKADPPDAAVLDVNLRDATSAPIVDLLRATAVPHVLVTGYSRNLLDDSCLRESTILSKPVRRRELIAILERALSCMPRLHCRSS